VDPTLSVTTKPDGARVYLNSELVGVTPFEGILVAPGDYVMTTELDGFVQSDTVLSIRGATRFAFALNPLDGSATNGGHILAGFVNESAQIEHGITSDDASTTPADAATPNGPTVTGNDRVSEAPAERRPRPTTGSLTLTSEPTKATVWLDGEVVGETPLTLRTIKAGDHTLQFTLPNFETYESKLSVNAGIATPLHAALEPVIGTIAVTVEPLGTIYVDGQLAGRNVSGLARFEVAPGPHMLRIESPDYGVKEVEVDVRPNREAELKVDFANESANNALAAADQLFDNGDLFAAREIYAQVAAATPTNTRAAAKVAEVDRLIEAEREQAATESIMENGVYLVVDKPPQLIGGLEALHREVRYPEAAFKAGVEGRVYVQFVVDEQGNPSDLKISKGLPLGCNEAAMSAIRAARFIPGEFKGRKVKVRHTLFVNFRK
jgi:TonB family protein